MSTRHNYSDFAVLFKKYRLKSEIETLSEFGNLLAEEGYIYEDSLFTRWQKGQRVPKDRKVLIIIIELFAKRGGINNIIEANRFLESTDSRDLNEEESSRIGEYFIKNTQTLPEQTEIFVGRELIVKEIIWMLLNNKQILLYGQPGIGKTAIAIRIGHLLKDKFPDGVLWIRGDLKKTEDILDEILMFLRLDVKSFKTQEKKIQQLLQISKQKKYLIILDNISSSQILTPTFKKLISYDIALLFTSVQPIFDPISIVKLKLSPLSGIEFFELCERTLGKPYVEQNRDNLKEIGHLLGFLPISCNIMLKQILNDPKNIRKFIEEINNFSFELDKMHYDNKNLFSSFEISFNSLDIISKKILLSSSIFQGTDFSSSALAYINNYSCKEIVPFLHKLISYSLIELSVKDRYQLHPAFKAYLRNKNNISDKIILASEYYIHEVKNNKNIEGFFNYEIENISGIMDVCIKLRKYRQLIRIWEAVKIYLWYLGKWNIILLFKDAIQNAYTQLNDKYGLVNFLGDDICRIYFFMKNYKQLNKCLNIALKEAISSGNNISIGLIEQKFGFVYLDNNRLEEAKAKLEKSIKLMGKKGPIKDLVKSHIYLGKTYLILGDLNKALKLLKSAYKKSKRYKIVEDTGLTHIFLGQLYIEKRNYKLAIKHFYLGLILEKVIKRKVVIAMAYEGIGDANEKLLHYSLSLTNYKNAYKLYNSLNLRKETNIILKKIAKLKFL